MIVDTQLNKWYWGSEFNPVVSTNAKVSYLSSHQLLLFSSSSRGTYNMLLNILQLLKTVDLITLKLKTVLWLNILSIFIDCNFIILSSYINIQHFEKLNFHVQREAWILKQMLWCFFVPSSLNENKINRKCSVNISC